MQKKPGSSDSKMANRTAWNGVDAHCRDHSHERCRVLVVFERNNSTQ